MIFCEIGTAVWITTSTVAMVQTGGYPRKPLRTELSVLHEEPGAIKCNRICAKFGETFGVSRVCQRGKQQEDQFMRTSILAIIVAFGTTIAVPALAQPSQQKQDDAAIKTHDSSTSSGTQDSGIAGDVTVREQEQKPAATTGTTKSR